MKKKKIIITICIAAGVIALGSFAAYRFFRDTRKVSVIENKNSVLLDMYTDKSRYAPSDTVNFKIKLSDKSKDYVNKKVCVYFRHLNKTVGRKEIRIPSSKEISFTWKAPKDDFTGYLVESYLIDNTSVKDYIATAVDVSSDYSRYPRYGYLTDFDKRSSADNKKIIDDLTKYHINCIQFYDWQYKHDKPLAGTVDKPDESWPDIANRTNYGATVKDFIKYCHENNMMAANYNLMFGAFYGYEKNGVKQDWALYKDAEKTEQDFHPLPNTWASSQLFIFNPANEEWQKYIFKREKEAMQVYPFDIWHVDSLGDRGYLYDNKGESVDLSAGYNGFLNNAKKALNKRIVFNPVNGYGESNTAAKSDLDFLYKEIWPTKYATFDSIKNCIDLLRGFSPKYKAVVLAAYMNYNFKEGHFNDNAVKLTDAAMFSNGASHIEIGDKVNMLCNEYFPNKDLVMSDKLKKDMRSYYDFLTAYENILLDKNEEVDKEEAVRVENYKTSDTAEADSIWASARKNDKYEMINLINLLGVESTNWRDDDGECKKPKEAVKIKVKYYTDTDVKKVNLASPDIDNGKSTELSFKKGSDSKGKYIEISVPKLEYWDVLYFEK